ncbi:hypothetical protein BKA70DRAFT_1234197 [Coprinopsis sp. MPI-PUGE-AT-0042]|nr:hypothetical protein BKA70DRAFT_1234197 [Coprinopsis sp. MPI-PUGE-AT-0042]
MTPMLIHSRWHSRLVFQHRSTLSLVLSPLEPLINAKKITEEQLQGYSVRAQAKLLQESAPDVWSLLDTLFLVRHQNSPRRGRKSKAAAPGTKPDAPAATASQIGVEKLPDDQDEYWKLFSEQQVPLFE